ncbi:G5 domain-containing protein [Actinoplanes sp. ATCC 53533]|uniref:G5 domain-containing protein n=1 Tax=Actinoplanes sp. ATCC 53533 TaxID=1288362 RepID=UPI0013156E17|nr:G5 domain-containing protein [Actinoplanes sp. ATCC 53533]
MTTAGLGVLALVAGTAGGIAALTSNDTRVVTAVGREAPVVDLPAGEAPPADQTGLGNGAVGHAQAEQQAAETRSAPGEADRTATRAPRRTTSEGRKDSAVAAAPVTGAVRAAPPAVDAPAAPEVRTEQVSETEAIPFHTRLVRDPSLPPGTREIETPGVPGERMLRYEVTYTGGRETSRKLLDSTITREPQDRVVAFGNRGRGGRHGGQHGGQHSGGRGDRECRLLGSCVRMGRGAVCTPNDKRPDGKSDARQESIIDGDLSLLDPSDIDELELTLPCEDKK